LALGPEFAHVLADSVLGPEDALPPEPPDGWETGWAFHKGLCCGEPVLVDEALPRTTFSWNGRGSGELAAWRDPDRTGLGHATFGRELQPLISIDLAAWPQPVWFQRWHFVPDAR
jgi:hypothetical protein